MESVEIINGFYDFVKSDDVLDIARLKPNSFVRKSPMEFPHIIRFMLSRGPDNTTVELDKYCESVGIQTVSRQAYSSSRQQIQPKVFKHLNNWLIDKIYECNNYKNMERSIDTRN